MVSNPPARPPPLNTHLGPGKPQPSSSLQQARPRMIGSGERGDGGRNGRELHVRTVREALEHPLTAPVGVWSSWLAQGSPATGDRLS